MNEYKTHTRKNMLDILRDDIHIENLIRIIDKDTKIVHVTIKNITYKVVRFPGNIYVASQWSASKTKKRTFIMTYDTLRHLFLTEHDIPITEPALKYKPDRSEVLNTPEKINSYVTTLIPPATELQQNFLEQYVRYTDTFVI